MKRIRLSPVGSLSSWYSKCFAASHRERNRQVLKPLESLVVERTYTSSQPVPRLLSFAPEMVQKIIKQVGSRRDLSNARLACKTLDKHTDKELFKGVLLSPLEGHIESWNNISQDPTSRYIPRHAIIHTQSDIESHGFSNYREPDEISDNFKRALAALSNFPSLDSLTIGFTPECVGVDKEYWQEVAEDVEQRQEMLSLIFQAIKNRSADPQNRAIRKLTILNLQNYPLPEFTSSTLFREVMGNLDELHISITQEYCEHGRDHDYTKIELQTFPAYFCADWLQPISANLKALSIYHGFENWGPFPGYFDPSGIAFPKLETLALGYYTLAHESDINWILAIKSLRKLVLHNCMIASRISISHENMHRWKPSTHDWTKLPNTDSWCEEFAYAGKWSHYLDRIAEALPNLRDFAFDSGPQFPISDKKPYGIQHRDACCARIFPQRYICFNNEILPTHWPEVEDDGEMNPWLKGFPNMHIENLEADQKSLDKLLRWLKRPRV